MQQAPGNEMVKTSIAGASERNLFGTHILFIALKFNKSAQKVEFLVQISHNSVVKRQSSELFSYPAPADDEHRKRFKSFLFPSRDTHLDTFEFCCF